MIKPTLETVLSENLSEIWNAIDNKDKHRIIDAFEIHNFKKNQLIYAEGETPEYLWCLLNGKVKKYKDGVGGRVQILRLIRSVQYFGYRAYFANELYNSSAAAFEPSRVGTLPMELVVELIDKYRGVAWFFLHELSRNLGSSDTKIVNLTQKHIRGRLAEALIILRDHYGYEDDDMTLKIYMGREDLANLSNMTTSNAIRTLSGFVNEGLITVDGRRICLLNEPVLRKISKHG